MELAGLVNEPSLDAKAKRFPPLENNPEVMTSLLQKLGMSRSVACQDVYSIDDPSLLAFVPRPAYALLLVFPVSEIYEKFREEEDAGKAAYDGYGDGEEVLWFKQTIANACGMYGLLHGAGNGEARKLIDEGSDLDKLLKDAISLRPADRSDLLVQSEALEKAHGEAAARGDSEPVAADASVDLHYVCFVKSEKGNLWEMDGRRTGPINRGPLDTTDDVLSEKALDLGVRSFLKREEAAGGGELRFSLIALSPSLD